MYDLIGFTPRRLLIPALAFLIVIISGASPAAQESPLLPVQNNLKQLQYLSGEPSGTLDAPTVAALKRFQTRMGLQITGDINAETLRALAVEVKQTSGVESPPANPDATARERALKKEMSDAEFNRYSGDRELLKRPELETSPRQAPQPVPRTQDVPPTLGANRKSLPAEPASQRTNPEPRGQEHAEPRDVIERFVEAAQQPTPELEISFYADRVQYFDSGMVNQAFIEKDQNKYYRRWPDRKFEILGAPEVADLQDNLVSVRLRLKYSLRRGRETASGLTENLIHLEDGPQGYKIVSIRERKLPR